uniref:G-protein coupled receptors family 1 profile domain-containing protein n=1 Tax=Romanomermis culicivorax TaxID=13658 RepID=A0A915IPW5_ROMCU
MPTLIKRDFVCLGLQVKFIAKLFKLDITHIWNDLKYGIKTVGETQQLPCLLLAGEPRRLIIIWWENQDSGGNATMGKHYEKSPSDGTNKDSMASPMDIFRRVLAPSMMKDDQLLSKNVTFLNINDEFDQWDYEDGNASEILWLEFTSFIDTWESLIRIYVPLEMGIMSMGLFGNLLAFVTLIRSFNLNTPSITYHKTLVLADLIFCSNYFFNNVVVDKLMMIGGRENQFEFTTRWAAYYSGIVYRALHLTCTYLISYMTLVITFDRFAALILYKRYQKFNKDSVAGLMVFFCVFLSAFVHSWSAWALRIAVKTSEISQTDSAVTNNTNKSETYTWIKNPNLHRGMQTAIRISSYYNGIVRLIYPFVVFLLTGLVIYGFIRRQKHIATRYASWRNMGREIRQISLSHHQNIMNLLALINQGDCYSWGFVDTMNPFPGVQGFEEISSIRSQIFNFV